MITTDFAPNESWDDALVSLITILRPWLWFEGKERQECAHLLNNMFSQGKATLFLSARSALFFLLQSLNLPKNSSVIVLGFTCEAVVLPIQAAKLHPIYVDIEKDTYCVDYDDLIRKLVPNTKVIILQHTFGLLPKCRDKVLQLAKDKKLFIIEDLAHGFDPVFWQSSRISDNQILLVSFGRSKALSSVFGGALITSSEKLHTKLRLVESTLNFPSSTFLMKLLCYKPLSVLIKNTYNIFFIGKIIHRIVKSLGLMGAEISGKEKRGEYDPYLEKKYPNALAKLLLNQLRKYAEMGERRKKTTLLYKKHFSFFPTDTPTRFPLLIENKDTTLNDVLNKSIYLGTWYSQPVAPVGLNLHKMGYIMGSCPVAEEVCKKIVNLPTLISEKNAEDIVKALENFQSSQWK